MIAKNNLDDKLKDITGRDLQRVNSMKTAFYRWLSDKNTSQIYPQEAIRYIDWISKYAENKKKSCILWQISDDAIFASIYQSSLNMMLKDFGGNDLYKLFISAGKSYVQFLKENAENITAQTSSNKNLPHINTSNSMLNAKTGTIEAVLTQDDCKENAITIISTMFKNGFRISSTIDFERFKNFYFEKYGSNISRDVKWLDDLLSAEALIYDDRAYIYNEEVFDMVTYCLNQLSTPCIYIDAFFYKYNRELYSFNIFSVEMLRAFIKKNCNEVFIKYDYLLLQDNILPSDMIKAAFFERETWSFEELYIRFPFLKRSTIRQVMNDADYIRVDKGTYTHIDNIDLPVDEGEKLAAFIETKLLDQDYVTTNELDLAKLLILNSHCSAHTIRDAILQKFLSDKYKKSGQVITKSGENLRMLDILEQYCTEASTVSFEELNTLEISLDQGRRSHSLCLIAGHNVMVRVSAELFIAENSVDFDIECIDEAIALYCQEDFIPLRRIVDFSLFPYVGYTWNLFLLESYVRKFSRVFRYDVRAVNSNNIGVIVKKTFSYNDYDDILAVVLAKSALLLSDKKIISDYLFDNGYIGWRNLGKNENKIIKNAMALREGAII